MQNSVRFEYGLKKAISFILNTTHNLKEKLFLLVEKCVIVGLLIRPSYVKLIMVNVYGFPGINPDILNCPVDF